MFSTPWIFSLRSKFFILISGSHKAQLRCTQAFSLAIFSFKYFSVFCFFWRCFLLLLLFGIFGRFGFDIEFKFVFESNFSSFLFDEFEYIDSVSFIIFDEFNEGDDILLLLLSWLFYILFCLL